MAFTDAEFQAWLYDTTRNAHRIVLIEVDHSTGTIHLSDDGWFDVTNNVGYDGWLLSDLQMRSTLNSFRGVGEFQAINHDDDFDWLALDVRGYECRWYVGDDEWLRDDFRQVAAQLNDECNRVNGRIYQFNMVDGGRQLEQTFTNVEYTFTGTATSAISDIMTKAGLPAATYTNISTARDFSVDVTFSDTETVDSAIKRIADSIGAYVRYSQIGEVEVFIPDIATLTPIDITGDDIIEPYVSMLSSIPAYKTVVVVYAGDDANGDPNQVSGTTVASTGQFNETKTITTVLANLADATTILNEALAYCAVKHLIWEIGALDITHLIQDGSVVSVSDYELTGQGLVNRIVRAPLSQFTTVEVTI